MSLPRSKPSAKFAIGIALTAYAMLMLLAVLCRGWPGMNIDYPCELGLGPGPSADASTRITYCISWWPRNAISGGGVAAYGASDQDRVEISPTGAFGKSLTVERQEQILIVNGQTLQVGETCSWSYWLPSLNPWLLLTSRLTIVNRGMVGTVRKMDQDQIIEIETDAMYLSGDLTEGWAPNPLGLACLLIGVWLLAQGFRERKRGKGFQGSQLLD
jgi:hypothetical protein